MAPAIVHAQSCPAGLSFIGRLSAESGEKEDVKSYDNTLLFPEGFHIDRHYHQASVVAAGGARSDLTTDQIPAGVYIYPRGNKEWAVSKPQLVSAVVEDEVIKQYKFSMYLYCSRGGATFAGLAGGCDVHVDVCAKSR